MRRSRRCSPTPMRSARTAVRRLRADARPCNAAARMAIPALTANPALGAAVDLLVAPWRHRRSSPRRPRSSAPSTCSPAAPRAERGGREDRRSDRLVDGICRARWRRDEQQPLAGQQGGRAHHHTGEVARRGGEGRHLDAARRSTATPNGSTRKGFVYMDTPGYDPVAATGQVAGGANMLCFTTGRGSAYGCSADPVGKACHQFRALRAHGRGTWTSIAATSSTACPSRRRAARSFSSVLDIAWGKRSKSELLGYGRR